MTKAKAKAPPAPLLDIPSADMENIKNIMKPHGMIQRFLDEHSYTRRQVSYTLESGKATLGLKNALIKFYNQYKSELGLP